MPTTLGPPHACPDCGDGVTYAIEHPGRVPEEGYTRRELRDLDGGGLHICTGLQPSVPPPTTWLSGGWLLRHEPSGALRRTGAEAAREAARRKGAAIPRGAARQHTATRPEEAPTKRGIVPV